MLCFKSNILPSVFPTNSVIINFEAICQKSIFFFTNHSKSNTASCLAISIKCGNTFSSTDQGIETSCTALESNSARNLFSK